MTTSFEDRLRESMERGATGVGVPSPPDLRDVARRRQARRGLVAVLGSAALVAAIVGVPQAWERQGAEAPPSTRSPSPSPSSTPLDRMAIAFEDLPVGQPPRIPHLRDGVLTGPGVTGARLTGTSLVVAGEELLLEDDGRWSIRTGEGTFEELLGVLGTPALSPDGRTLVYASLPGSGPSRVTLVALDLERGLQRIGVRSIPVAGAEGTTLALLGVDNERRVFWVDGPVGQERTFVWWPELDRQERLAFGWEGDRLIDVGPDEVLMAHAGGREGYVGPLVTDPDTFDSAVKKRWPVVDPELATYSPGGGHLLQHDAWITPLDGDPRRVRLLLDGSLRPEGATFESPDAVLVHIRKGERRGIARCLVDTGACELAAELTDAVEVVFPATRPWIDLEVEEIS